MEAVLILPWNYFHIPAKQLPCEIQKTVEASVEVIGASVQDFTEFSIESSTNSMQKLLPWRLPLLPRYSINSALFSVYSPPSFHGSNLKIIQQRNFPVRERKVPWDCHGSFHVEVEASMAAAST